MTEHAPDGIDEALETTLRLGLTVASRIAEQAARNREQAARQAEAASLQEARELSARIDAERAAARASFAPVEHAEWWDRADPQQIADAWQTARTWEAHDPDAARAAQRIRDELRDRYGIDADAPGADPTRVRDELERRGQLVDTAAGERAAAAGDQAEAARLLRDPEQAVDPGTRAAEAAAVTEVVEELYDTAERRDQLAGYLEERGAAAGLEAEELTEAMEARVVADVDQGRPANAAAMSPSGPARAKRARGRGAGRSRERQIGRAQ